MWFQNSHFAASRARHGGGKHFSLGTQVQRERPGFGSGGGPSSSIPKTTTVDSSNPFDDDGPPVARKAEFLKTTSVGPMADWRGGSSSSSGASGSNRMAAMKSAYQSQFKSSFV